MPGVFDGLRVLDLSHGIAGPMTTMHLADNGALVTRIDPPGRATIADSGGTRVWNRGKRHAEIDLAEPEGRDAFLALADAADVVVESFAPGTAANLGIDHPTLALRNPMLITCSITGYGRNGRDRDRPGYDALVAARTGLFYDQKGRRGTAMEYICGRPGPHPDIDAPEDLVRGANRAGPVFPRTPWPSMGAMHLATLGITAALRAREVTGEGQWVETSLFQGALAAVCLNWRPCA
jgi:crotonobetainyl-CoA:carnitine CoA-transferase CaiB-like acyl-CoA transferase